MSRFPEARNNNERFVAILAVGFAILSLWVFFREYDSYFDRVGKSPQDYVLLENAFTSRPLGLYPIDRDIEICFSARASLAKSILQATAKTNGFQACLDMADQTIAAIPTHAAAWQVRAEMLASLAALGLTRVSATDVVDAQLMAAATAPNTAWLMQRRLVNTLALPQSDVGAAWAGDRRTGMVAKMLAADIAKLIGLAQTRRWLANMYLRDPALRQFMQTADIKVAQDDLSKFTAQLKNGAREMGGSVESDGAP